ncbi:MAG: galactose-1-phosphate uridylyltransferase [Candidatus Omnitrophica bacterium]|nr:galactose-1-phosphate uridylyltransferase [Candidatus Omnitrophota bacterium]
MSELRKDPIIGRWVIISVERTKRPNAFALQRNGPPEEECLFCEGKESQTSPEIFAIRKEGTKDNEPGWDVRVVPSNAPFLRIEGDLNRRGKGLYDVMNGIGAHEIIIETPQHIMNLADLSEEQIAKVLSSFVERVKDLEKDPRFKYALVFKNYGWSAEGGRVNHSCSQLIATPITPKSVKEELSVARKYYELHERCIFCDLIKQEIDTQDRLVLDINGFITIVPFASRFPFEMCILPKKHSCDFYDLDLENILDLARIIKKTLLKLKKGLNDPSFNLILHTAPFKRKKVGYWKTINEDYHWHIEIMPRLTRVAGFEWGTGFYICPIPPEDAAQYLKEIEV